jgi:hypothetical protein
MTNSGYTTLGEIKRANAAAGYFWWSTTTVKTYRPKLESAIYVEQPREDYPKGSRSWVESTRDYTGDSREYKLVRFNCENGDVSYIRDGDRNICRFPTRRAALDELRDIVLEVQQCSTM